MISPHKFCLQFLAIHLLAGKCKCELSFQRVAKFLRVDGVPALFEAEVAHRAEFTKPIGEEIWQFKKKMSISNCTLAFCASVPLATVGLSILLGLWRDRVNSELLMSEEADSASGHITGKRHYTTKDSEGDTVHHYVLSYTFEGVRHDGMRCKVIVTDRKQSLSVWKSLPENSAQVILYSRADPTWCRLKDAAELDFQGTRNFCGSSRGLIMIFIATVTLGIGLFLGVMGAGRCGVEAWGLLGGLGITFIWILCLTCGVIAVRPIIDSALSKQTGSVQVEELGCQTISPSLHDISGLWLFDSPLGKFEYKFEMHAAHVTIQGRVVQATDWGPECIGYFAGQHGTELIWEDSDRTKFVVTFDGQDRFEGFAKPLTGNRMVFNGTRSKV